MIIETTNYFAKPEKAELVLRQRRRASAIRVSLGLPPGRISVKREGAGADVRWELTFRDEEAYQADRQARAASPAFEANRKGMHELLERFERFVETVDDAPLPDL